MLSQKTKAQISDWELIESVKSGNQSAFKAIVSRHKSSVAATVYGMLGKCLEAEDIGQEVFIRFYKAINKFRGEAELSTYLTRIAINLSLNEINKRKKRTFFSFDSWANDQLDKGNLEEKNTSYERKEIIAKAISKLKDNYKSVLVLRLINGFSTEETAEILNVPVGTVLSRLYRAQEKLRKILSPYVEEL